MSIDILMATYNGEKYIEEQIDSILAQTYHEWRLLVSDDCSTDATLAILRDYEREDPRIKVVSEGKRYGGAKENFWSLLPHAKAPYVMFCDQDDIWYSKKIEITLAEMMRLERRSDSETPILVYTDSRLVDAAGELLIDSFASYIESRSLVRNSNLFLFRNVAPGCTMMMNRPLLGALTALEDTSAFDIHDWWAALVASALGEVSYLDVATIDYRQHDNNARGLSGIGNGRLIPSFDGARQSMLDALARADLLLELYSDRIKESERKKLVHFARVRRGGLIGVNELRKSAFWRNTPRRRFGQIAVTLFGNLDSNNQEVAKRE